MIQYINQDDNFKFIRSYRGIYKSVFSIILMEEKYILVSLEDEKAKKIAEILGNKTCKKILDFLAETKEASEQDISNRLGIPINTVEYNLKKLIESGLIEKAKNFFWSVKGRKIDLYRLVKKHIVISTKSSKPSLSKLKSIVPAVLISGVFALIIRAFYNLKTQQVFEIGREEAVMKSVESVASAGSINTVSFIDKIFMLPAWIWFFAGAIIAILIILGLNWRKF